MKKLLLYTLCCIIHTTSSHIILGNDPDANSTQIANGQESKDSRQSRSSRVANNKYIKFNYVDEDLVDIINYIAAEKNLNIELPLGAHAIKSKVTFNMPEPISLQEAWELLHTILDIDGYTLAQKRDDIYTITKNSKNISREVLPLYVNIEPEKLPDSDERIRYLYYLANIRVSTDPKSDLRTILTDFLPTETASFQLEPRTNAVIITERSNVIKSVMKLVKALDNVTFQERIEVVKLRYTSASNVATLFNEILKPNDKTGMGNKGKSESLYFSENVKLIAEPRTNALIIIGRGATVDRIKDFIKEYVDADIESGKSVLHVYQLLYLDASTFAPTLQSIVNVEKSGGTGQSSAGSSGNAVDRYFQGVIVKADQPTQGSSFGSNKLIIAANSEDWIHIKHLIEQLDKPQPQVILEILIADITLDDLRTLGTMLRNPASLPLPGLMNIQSAQIAQVVLNVPTNADSYPPTTTIASDLLGQVIPNSSSPTGFISVASLTGSGLGNPGQPQSTLLSISDPGTGSTWGLLQILQGFSSIKILSHPHVITTNNKEAKVSIGQQRLLPGEATATAAAPTIKTDLVNATLEVIITPRISGTESVNLKVSISASDYAAGAAGAANVRTDRILQTNANVKSNDILALGGLIRVSTSDSINETPLLSKIPILGWLFKARASETTKTNVTVFISPTIIQPRLRRGIDSYTKEYIELAGSYASESNLFEGLRDPITRFFFRTQDYDAQASVAEFMKNDELKDNVVVIPAKPMTGELRKIGEQPKQHQQELQAAQERATSRQPLPQTVVAPEKPERERAKQPEQNVVAYTNKNTRIDDLKKLLENEENPLLNTHHLIH